MRRESLKGNPMKDMKWYWTIPLSLLSSFLLILSFPPFNANIFGFIALAPILFIAYTSSLRKTVGCAFIFAYIFYCIYLFWMNAYLAVVGVLFVTVVFGTFFVLSLIFINVASRAFPRYRAFLTPFIWIGFDYIRSFGFLGFTFGSIGYTQHNFTSFIQLADVGGEQLIAFILVLFSAGLAETAVFLVEGCRENRTGAGSKPYLSRFYPLAGGIILIIVSLVYGSIVLSRPLPEGQRMKLSLIQGLSTPRTEWKKEKWKTLKGLENLSRESIKNEGKVDLVVWTETAIRTSLRPNLIYGSAYHTRIQRLVREIGAYFIIGSPDNFSVRSGEVKEEDLETIYPTKGDEEIWTNSAYFMSPDGEIIDKYDKIQLTPFGEHFPLGNKIRFLQKILDNFTDSAGFTPGAGPVVFDHEKMDFGVVICWEGTYGYFIRDFVRAGADFMVNISNDMWTKTRAGHFQHFTITKFRAIENRIWFARAANDGVTAIVDPRGRVVDILPIKEAGYLVGEIGPKEKTTFYTRAGDLLPRTALAVLVLSFIGSLVVLIRRAGER